MSIPQPEDLKGQPAILATRRFDLFQIPPFLGVGEPYLSSYETTRRNDSEHRRNFAVGPAKEGKFLTLASPDSDKYMAKEKPVEKEVIKIPFRTTSPTKKPSGSGSPYGCFSTFQYISPQPLEKTIEKNSPLPKPNIRIQPPRKGPSNTPHILFKEFEYISEASVSNDKRLQTTGSKEQSKSPIPLHISSRTGGLFDPNIYRPVEMPSSERRESNNYNSSRREVSSALPSSSSSSSRTTSRTTSRTGTHTPSSAINMTRPATSLAYAGRVFRPTSPSKTGWQGTFSTYEYMSPNYFTERAYSPTGTDSSSTRRGNNNGRDGGGGRGDGNGSGSGSGSRGGGGGSASATTTRPSTSPGGTRRMHEPIFRPVGKSVFVVPQPSIAFYQANTHRTFLQAQTQGQGQL